MDAYQTTINKIIDLYFNQPNVLYNHLFNSYNQLIEEIIPYFLYNEQNYFYECVDKDMVYMNGFKCSNIGVKSSVFDSNNEIKFPDDARKNHLNYFATIIADVTQFVEIIDTRTGKVTTKIIGSVEKQLAIANIPIMIKSKYCTTNIKNDLHNECKYDPGGYFIVNGQEKVVMSIEKMVDNKVLVFGKKDNTYVDNIVYVAQINSKKNDWSDNLQILTIKPKKDGVLIVSTSLQLVNVSIFVLMRALGVESDKDIISYITYDLSDYKMIDLLRASMLNSVDDNDVPIKTQEQAIEFLITKLKRNKRFSSTDEELCKNQKKIFLTKILTNDLLPHLGDDIHKKKIFIGYIVNKLLNVILKRIDPDDRDGIQNKRIETPGILLSQLFRQNWKRLLNEIGKNFKKKYQSFENPISVISQIKPNIIEQGIKTALSTGIWGINKTKKGVAQSLQRLSWVQGISYLRRIMLPSVDDSTVKVTSIRQVNQNQCQLLCCIETPEGAKIGVVKSLAMMASITMQNIAQSTLIKKILNENSNISRYIIHPYNIDDILTMNNYTKIFINGDMVGLCKIKNSLIVYNELKKLRYDNLIDKHVSILYDYKFREIKIYSDGGRLIRPLLIVKDHVINFSKELIDDIEIEYNKKTKASSWYTISSKYKNIIEYEDIESLNYLLVSENLNKLNENYLHKNNKCESINSKYDINRYGEYRWVNYTHCEFHAWVMLGTIATNIPFSNHNYAGRNILCFSQLKQAVSIYLSSYKNRIDNSQLLYHPQIPLVITQGMKYNSCLDLPFGENAIVAILSYNGYIKKILLFSINHQLIGGYLEQILLKNITVK